MQDTDLKTLADEIEAADAGLTALRTRLAEALGRAGVRPAPGMETLEGALDAVMASLPGWAVSIDGTASASHGHWTATLRRSRERDNDEAIGTGHAETPRAALAAALVRALAAGARG